MNRSYTHLKLQVCSKLLVFLVMLQVPVRAQLSDSLYHTLPDEYKPKNRHALTNVEMRLILFGAGEYVSSSNMLLVGELNRLADQLEKKDAQSNVWTRVANLAAIGVYHWGFLNKGSRKGEWVPYYERALALAKTEKNPKPEMYSIMSQAYMAIGEYHDLNSRYEEAARNYTSAMTQALTGGDTAVVGGAYDCLAQVYTHLKLFKVAIAYTDSIEHYRTVAEIKSYKNAFLATRYDKKSKLYLEGYEQERDKAYLDSAWSYITMLGNLMQQDPSQNSYLGSYYFDRAHYFYTTGHYQDALRDVDSALKVQDENFDLMPGKLVLKGLSLVQTGRIAEGKKLLQENAALINNDFALATTVYKTLYQTAKQQSNATEALRYFELSHQYQDSNDVMRQRGQVFEVTRKYDVAQKEARIRDLQARNLISSKERNQARLMVAVTILVLLICALVFYILLRRQQQRRLAAEREVREEQRAKDELQLLNNIQRQMIRQETIIAQRKEISEDMHDQLGSSLAALKFYIGDLRQHEENAGARDLLARIETEADFVYTHSRQYMHSLHHEAESMQADYNGFLYELLRRFAAESSAPELVMELDDASLRASLDQDQYNHLIRIVLELVTNIRKHAHAGKARVTVRLEQGHCRLQVWDNGVGFDMEVQEGGLGLQSIRNRVNALNGIYRVETSRDGTAVEVDFPLTKKDGN